MDSIVLFLHECDNMVLDADIQFIEREIESGKSIEDACLYYKSIYKFNLTSRYGYIENKIIAVQSGIELYTDNWYVVNGEWDAVLIGDKLTCKFNDKFTSGFRVMPIGINVSSDYHLALEELHDIYNGSIDYSKSDTELYKIQKFLTLRDVEIEKIYNLTYF